LLTRTVESEITLGNFFLRKIGRVVFTISWKSVIRSLRKSLKENTEYLGVIWWLSPNTWTKTNFDNYWLCYPTI